MKITIPSYDGCTISASAEINIGSDDIIEIRNEYLNLFENRSWLRNGRFSVIEFIFKKYRLRIIISEGIGSEFSSLIRAGQKFLLSSEMEDFFKERTAKLVYLYWDLDVIEVEIPDIIAQEAIELLSKKLGFSLEEVILDEAPPASLEGENYEILFLPPIQLQPVLEEE